jgi:hypothetical protein
MKSGCHDLTSLRIGVLSALTACLGASVLASCQKSGDPLPTGYSIFIASSSEIFLEEPKYGGSISQLGTDLEEVGNHNEFIFGRSGPDRGSPSGYFLLDTRDGSIKTGLGHAEWLAETKAAGIPSPPELVSPSRKTPQRR